MADRPTVVAEDLRKTFGKDVKALDGVSFEVQPGTVLGLLGPNGAGKTTSVNVLTTLLRADSGRAEVAGVDVMADPAEVRRRIGLAGQYAAVDEMLTGRENLTLVGRLNHMATADTKRRAGELLDRFELSDAGDRPAKTYSGGMRRRLDLAAALVARPPVLFLDEPTTGLDPRSRLGLWGVIEDLVRDGTTLLLTTQYLEEADRLADRISVIDHGRVIAEGTSAELKARLGAAVVEVVLDTEEQAEEVRRLLGECREATREEETVRVPAPDGTATLATVVRTLDDAGLTARGLQLREPSLDDVFLDLTGKPADAGTTEEKSA
ncbi:ATP-binding cassette domain-containing protein [uncultured Nocardioides sp.]|uniref:ATP-binding cassette domain-containing protein n=1 Tax=uncultured Nocardioides sp. TaxID=198441 RepID=UPI00262439DE|nr:ATP-binding cassette domain-containing protein [uncultured Nocardioides sp.]